MEDLESTGLWLAWNEGTEKNMETISYIGLYRNYCKDPFRHSYLIKGQSRVYEVSDVENVNPKP